MAHPTHPTEHETKRFTAEQLEALRAEPMLVVEVLPDPKPKPKPKPGDGEDGKDGKDSDPSNPGTGDALTA
jgi:hypothetical protein